MSRGSNKSDEKKSKQGSPLAVQLLAGFVAIALLVALVTGLTLRNNERAYFRNVVAQDLKKRFELIVAASREELRAHNSDKLREQMTAAARLDPGLHYLHVTAAGGETVYSWIRGDAHDYERSVGFAREILVDGRELGRVSASWEAGGPGASLGAHIWRIAFSLLTACLVFSLLAFLLVDHLALKPIAAITGKFANSRHNHKVAGPALPRLVAPELRNLDRSIDGLRDIHAHRNREQAELQASKDLARSAALARTEFLAKMSHELRTPLNAINGFSELLATEIYGALGDPRYLEYSKNIHRSGTNLLILINDILDLSELEAKKAELNLDTVDLAGAIRDCVELVRSFAEINGLKLRIDIAQNLPLIRADPQRLSQILLNILSNAIKFTRPGGEIRISAAWTAPGSAVVTIADTGIGIAAENIERVVEPFAQIEGPEVRSHGGAGLGLALVEALVKLHGGALNITSQREGGTEVTFTLPVPGEGGGNPKKGADPTSVPGGAIPAV